MLSKSDEDQIGHGAFRTWYRGYRLQAEAGHCTQMEACEQLKAVVHGDAMAWLLFLALLLTITAPVLIAGTAHDGNDWWPDRVYWISLMLSVAFNIKACSDCVHASLGRCRHQLCSRKLDRLLNRTRLTTDYWGLTWVKTTLTLRHAPLSISSGANACPAAHIGQHLILKFNKGAMGELWFHYWIWMALSLIAFAVTVSAHLHAVHGVWAAVAFPVLFILLQGAAQRGGLFLYLDIPQRTNDWADTSENFSE